MVYFERTTVTYCCCGHFYYFQEWQCAFVLTKYVARYQLKILIK
jgi:hypothetical protein